MALYHVESDPAGVAVEDINGEIKFLEGLSDEEILEFNSDAGIDEKAVQEALAAAERVLSNAGVQATIVEISLESVNGTLECQCGSRCTGWTCQPYQRCWIENGRRVCVSGHKRVCTRRSCNPC